MKGDAGSSNIVSMVIIICFLMFVPILISFTGIYSTMQDINQIASSTVNMAKMTGGFRGDVLQRLDEMIQRKNIHKDKLEIIFVPGKYHRASKRDLLEICITYRDRISIVCMGDKSLFIPIEIPVRAKAFCHYYYKSGG